MIRSIVVGVAVPVIVAIILATPAVARSLIKAHKRRDAALERMEVALLGTEGDPEMGIEPVPGIVETVNVLRTEAKQRDLEVAKLSRQMLTNGGSTLRDIAEETRDKVGVLAGDVAQLKEDQARHHPNG